MKATELRVTNFVEHFGNYKPVAMIGYDSVMLFDKDGTVYKTGLDEINPISLTEELLKCIGFVFYDMEYSNIQEEHPRTAYKLYYCHELGEYISLSVFKVEDKEDNEEYIFEISLGNDKMKDNCKYFNLGFYYHLHEIQNLYFQLVGEDLKINI